jgi:hypothetical protein
MTNPLGPAGFFALEAGECLDRLDSLFRAADGPPADEVLRTARALRGSALMANQPPLSRAAAGFEMLARALRAGDRTWDDATREQANQAVEEYRLLVRRVPEWQESDGLRSARLTVLLESLAGRAPAETERVAPESATAQEMQTGVRAFVAREGALIASALDRAARAMRNSPDDRESLYMVLRRMQSLQGLAELPDLPPLPDILDGIELAVGDLSRLHAPPPGVDQVLEAGARALSRVARDIADRGVPDPEAEEPRQFTALLLEAFAVERDVVAIESLYRAGDAEPAQRPRSVPQFAPPAPPGSLELVSLGEHLVQTAGRLVEARSVTELDLRLYRLVGTLRAAAGPDGDPVAQALGALARAARETVASGTARVEREPFAGVLRAIGDLLRSAPGLERDALATEIAGTARRLSDLGPTVVPIESLAFDGEPVFADRGAAAPAAVAGGGPGARANDVARDPRRAARDDVRRLSRAPEAAAGTDSVAERAAGSPRSRGRRAASAGGRHRDPLLPRPRGARARGRDPPAHSGPAHVRRRHN